MKAHAGRTLEETVGKLGNVARLHKDKNQINSYPKWRTDQSKSLNTVSSSYSWLDTYHIPRKSLSPLADPLHLSKPNRVLSEVQHVA